MRKKPALLLTMLLFAAQSSFGIGMRVGTAGTCPTEDSTEPINTEAAAVAAILSGLVLKFGQEIAKNVLDQVVTAISADVKIDLVAMARRDGFYVRAKKEKEKESQVGIDAAAKCVVIVVADRFGYVESGRTPLPEDFPAPAWARAEPRGDPKDPWVWVPDESESKKPTTAEALDMIARRIYQTTRAVTVPLFYLEGTYEIAPGNDAFAFRPTFGYFPKPLGTSWFSTGYREFRLALSWLSPGDTVVASTALEVKDFREGTAVGTDIGWLVGELSWMKLPSPATKPTVDGSFYPITIKASLVETDKRNGIAKALGAALAAQKDSIGKANTSK